MFQTENEYSDSEEYLIGSEKDTLEGMPKTIEDEKKSDGSKMNGIIVKFKFEVCNPVLQLLQSEQ